MRNGIHDTDDLLIDDLRSGKEKAFNAIYERFYERLYFFALRYVSNADAKDIVSEVFIELWHKRADFEHVRSAQHFMFVLVRNRCFNLLKHELMKTHKQADLLRQLETTGEQELDLEQVKNELVRLIYSEAEKLPAKMKTIFLLSFAEGLKPAEIAKRLDLSVQTVSNQKLNAIRLLKTALGDRSLLLVMLLLLYSEA